MNNLKTYNGYSLEDIKNMIKNNKDGVFSFQEIFIQVPNSFLRNELTPNEKTLYLILWGYSVNREGVYPSHSKLMENIGVSKNTLIKTINSLEDKGWIIVLNRIYKESKEKSSNIYYLAQIDNKIGSPVQESIKIIKDLFPDKTVYISK
ncbi:MAG: helix-turn-helix domain-containing protein [Clostridium sp.]